MVNEFWKYWKRRWPNASSDENKLRNSANYQETRAAFLAGYQAAQQMRAADFADCHACGIAYPNTATRCTKCGGELQSR